MKEKRRKYSPTQKVSILREHLVDGYTISELSEKFHIHPTQLTRWKKQLFEGAPEIFSQKAARTQQKMDKKLAGLQSKLSHKDGIIVELLEDNLRLKKNDGEF